MSSYTRAPKHGLPEPKTIHAVRVENLHLDVNRQEVIALFNTLIGDVCSTSDIKDSNGHHLTLAFSNRDACKKALCMSGYNVSGYPLTVIPIVDDDSNQKRNDDRRNLYVLGLPFDLSKAELTSIFSQYGTVAHCVILATVDNASRRRGFVVMSSHDEARQTMISLTRTQLRGHTIDISWAIVQRSQGFLDGGDRAILFDSQSHPSRMPSPDGSQDDNQFLPSTSTPNSSFGSAQSDSTPLTVTTMPTNILLVSELPSLLFSQMSDLHPLLDPFGKIDKLEIIDMPSVTPGTISVKVEYTSIANAREALDSLQGQCYANFRIRVEYVQVALPQSYSTDQYFATSSDIPAMNFAPPSYLYQPTPYSSRRVYIDHPVVASYPYAPPSARVYIRSNPRPSSVNSKYNDASRHRYPYIHAPYSPNLRAPVYNAFPSYRSFYS